MATGALAHAGGTRSTFLSACLEGNEARKQELLKSGIVLDLHEAAAAGDTARVDAILTRNQGSVNHRDLSDATPLHYAAACGQIAMANALLMKGAELGAVAAGLDDAAPAHFAASIADHKIAYQMLETLVGNGASPSARKSDGTTVLQIAVKNGHADAARLLIRRGADPQGALPGETIVRDCQTARYRNVQREDTYGLPQFWINDFLIASHFDFDKVSKMYGQCHDLLLTRSTWDEIGVEAAAHMGRIEMVNFFVEKGSPVSLSTATMLGEIAEVKKLLAEDPHRVHERGAHDFPVLWYTAFGEERPEILELLLASGADVRSGMMGNTIVQLAEKKKYNRLLELVRQPRA